MQRKMTTQERKKQLRKEVALTCAAIAVLVLAIIGVSLMHRAAHQIADENTTQDKTAAAQKSEEPVGEITNTASPEPTETPAASAETAAGSSEAAAADADAAASASAAETAAPTETPTETPTEAAATEAAAAVTDPNDNGMRRAEDGEQRYVYLTIDDGPSSNTERILDILAQYNIKATWFVVGKDDEQSIERYKKIIAAGHTIGMHSYTHDYSQVYASAEAFEADLNRIQTLLQEKVGYTATIYRFPGGSSNTTSKRKVSMSALVPILEARGIRYFDWNVDTTDGSGSNLSVDTLIAGTNQYMGKYIYNMLLLHDANDHNTTVDALPTIIQSCLDQGMIFLPITDDTPVIHHTMGW